MSLMAMLDQEGRSQTVKAGTHIFRQGDADDCVYAIRQGYLKAYYVSTEGKEHIKSLLKAGDLIGSTAAFEPGGACTFNLVAQTDCVLRVVPYSQLRAAAHRDHALALDLNDFLLAFARKKERREYELLCLPAADRYALIADGAAEQDPGFGAVFSQADMASYIGITPQALSRIKRRRTG